MHLADYLKSKQLSDEAFAEKIGTSRPTVSRIRRRKVRPDWDTIEAIKRVTRGKVTADDFMQIEAAE